MVNKLSITKSAWNVLMPMLFVLEHTERTQTDAVRDGRLLCSTNQPLALNNQTLLPAVLCAYSCWSTEVYRYSNYSNAGRLLQVSHRSAIAPRERIQAAEKSTILVRFVRHKWQNIKIWSALKWAAWIGLIITRRSQPIGNRYLWKLITVDTVQEMIDVNVRNFYYQSRTEAANTIRGWPPSSESIDR